MQPSGNYPIHIIVQNGRTTLLGIVDNESDKTVAGFKAREIKRECSRSRTSSSSARISASYRTRLLDGRRPSALAKLVITKCRDNPSRGAETQ